MRKAPDETITIQREHGSYAFASLAVPRGIALCLLVLVLAGCGLSPNYVRPELDFPAEYAKAGEYGGSESSPASSAENRVWWQSFSSQALPVLQEMALRNNHAFQANRWALAQSLSRARAARASLFPTISVGASTGRSGRASRGSYQVSETFGGTVQAGYEVDIWGKNLESVTAQDLRTLADVYVWRGAGLTLESEVALTYFSYLAARENLAVYDATLANAREVLSYQEKRERLGATTPLDLARQRSSVHNMEAGRISYLVRMTESKNSICQLLGVLEMPDDLAALMDKEALRDILPPPVVAGLPSDLLFRRPDVAQAEARLQAANADIGIARAAFLPGINLTASTGWQSDSLSNLINPVNALYSLGASLAQPIFQGGRLLEQYRQTLAAHEELMERYRETTLGAFLDVSTALEANMLLDRQETERVLFAEQASEAYRIARLRYEGGAEDFLSVLDAQTTMLNADNQLVQTRLERLNTVVALFKALGGGWGDVNEADVYGKDDALAQAKDAE